MGDAVFPPAPIRVGILTGFLGAGKSTRLARLLKGPGGMRTAVVVNEFGAVGIDHDLLATPSAQVTLLENGCLCCVARGGLQDALLDLHDSRARGEIDFNRVLVETSGLADPGALLSLMALGGPLAGLYTRAGVVTLVDAGTGAALLVEFAEAARQVALADRVVLTHTDLAPPSTELRRLVEALNAGAPLYESGLLDFADLFDVAQVGSGRFTAEPVLALGHHNDFRVGTIIDERPTSEAVLELLLAGLQAQLGERLLRVKGFVSIAGAGDRILLVQGAHRRGIERIWWDGELPQDRRTRITVLASGLPPEWPAALYRCLGEEVSLSERWLHRPSLPVSSKLL